ncbi:transcriptional regulator family: Fungal Specific TF [Penicillium argentinense]|uniref:Transcriptional regulator family: Fungal Specific TF n=1 Tax=Penicillium argentinense TaxID=1131581 RepID=A0A9W9K2Q8_9EURO|nr:transcriptional regulator family: Fungal Specific TF [Penicillium argentinense]KAJ5090928.1 transcriptional regulator family: Fungal Specific TF [Penicillium argentinense]
MQVELKKAKASPGDSHGINELALRERELSELRSSAQTDDDLSLEWIQRTSDIQRLAGNTTTDMMRSSARSPVTYKLQSISKAAVLDPLHADATRGAHSHAPLEPVSNPLALMADAAVAAQAMTTHPEQAGTSPGSNDGAQYEAYGVSEGQSLLHRPGYLSLGLQLDRQTLERGLDALLNSGNEAEHQHLNYFRPPDMNLPRDVGPDLDPIDLGLITVGESSALFAIYFSHLHVINGILDPLLHTPEFVRSRSSLLFTWILALTAQFNHQSGHLATRLRLHGDKLSRHVHTCGFKSVEIVQGYYISLLSATPAKNLSEERSWLYTMYAFGVAVELGLDQPSRFCHYPVSKTSTSTISRIDERELPFQPPRMPQTSDQEDLPSCHSRNVRDVGGQAYIQRLARNQERTWFRISLWERANSAACGRVNVFPDTELMSNVHSWWMHPLADSTDKYTCAFVLLRRDIAVLQNETRRQAKFSQSNPHWARELINATFEPWLQRWLPSRATQEQPQCLPDLYLYYVYIHGRLWILSTALNASMNMGQNLEAIREDCFEAAIHCSEIAVHDLQSIGEPMYCMLSPTWAMISYAAILALKIFPFLHGSRPGQQVELLALLAQVALQLECAGSTPSHRLGIATLLGEHLMMILRTKVAGLGGMALTPEVRSMSSSSTTQENGGHRARQAMLTENHTTEFSERSRSMHPMVSTYDPFLTTATLGTETDIGDEGFEGLLREIFGPGFGDVY